MSVAIDAVNTAPGIISSSGTTVSNANLTVGAALSNGALWAAMCFDNSGSSAPTSISMHWDTAGTNQALTQVGLYTNGSNVWIAIFGLLAPTAGKKNLTCSWTGGQLGYLSCASFSGVTQASIAAAFANAASANGTTSPATLAVTSAVGNRAVFAFSATAAADLTTLDATTITAPNINDLGGSAAANHKAGAASVTSNCTLSGTGVWTVAGVNLVAASGAVAFILGDYTLDAGLAGMAAVCDKIFICGASPSSYADATSGANSLGSYNFGVGNAFTSDSSYAGGMQISSVAITAGSGSVSTNGTVAAWAAVDSANSRLLASGTLTGGIAVTAGQTFALSSFTIQMPKAP